MDFFLHQESARRRSGLLVFLFALAICAIIGSTYLSLCVLSPLADSISAQSDNATQSAISSHPSADWNIRWWQPKLLLIASLATFVVIACGSLYKIAELRGGGEYIALSMGGVLANESTASDSETRILLNIVEEMSIASGIPVPPVYVLEGEAGINAFAAGYTINNAVIAVSQGAIRSLSRDELQGVIAHEYSHILNGDMRTNIRIMGILHGILLIAIIGFYLIRITAYTGSRRGKNNPAIYLLFIGAAIVIIGSVGLFFGRLIKASLSRQREFLADASAVQFTRNPAGIAGALQKISEAAYGSRIKSPEAETASHMFFGNACRTGLFSLLATHPPLTERIKRIDPSLQLTAKLEGQTTREQSENQNQSVSSFNRRPSAPSDPALNTSQEPQFEVHSAVAKEPHQLKSVPNLGTQTLNEMFSQNILARAHEAYSARFLLFAILLSDDDTIRKNQVGIIKKELGHDAEKLLIPLYHETRVFNNSRKLTLLDICHPAINGLSETQSKQMKGILERLIASDQQIDLFEFMVQRIICCRVVDQRREKGSPNANHFRSYRPFKRSISTLIAAICYASGSDESVAQYHKIMFRFFPNGAQTSPLAKSELSLHLVSDAMDHVGAAAPQIKRRILDAAVASIADDDTTTMHELELVRALSASLCLPPPALP